MDPYAYLGAGAARAGLASGAFSAVEYVSALLARSEQSRHLHAFLSLAREHALRAAESADRHRAAGLRLPPLHGVPFAVKDLIDVRGAATSGHSRVPAPRATRTAASVLRLQHQGAIYLGKLALEEFGIGSPLDALAWPSPANPWDSRRTAGGSSSGSAVALAAGLVPLALGTDTGGSVRAPAAYCGLTALKPTHARVDLHGVLPLAPTLDTIGPMARSAEDCALLLAGLVGPRRDAQLERSRIGVVDLGATDRSIDADIEKAMTVALSALDSVGGRVETAGPLDFALARKVGGTILSHEAYTVHRRRLATDAALYGETCRRRLEAGAAIPETDYLDALEQRLLLRAQVDRLLERFDAIALPVTLEPAALLHDAPALARSGDFTFRVIFNITGHPAVAFCTGFHADGLPLSMQLVGRHGEDERLLDLVAAYQQVTSWHEMHPPAMVGQR